MRKHQYEIKRIKDEDKIAKQEWIEAYQVKIDEQRAEY